MLLYSAYREPTVYNKIILVASTYIINSKLHFIYIFILVNIVIKYCKNKIKYDKTYCWNENYRIPKYTASPLARRSRNSVFANYVESFNAQISTTY